MRFRGFLSALLILSVLAVSAATSSAQEPAPATAFDGKYVGTATSPYAHDVAFCIVIRSIGMTITGGQVRIHELLPSGGGTYRGSVNAAGEVSASGQSTRHFITVSGTIHDNVFTGQRLDGARRVANTASKWPQHPRQRRRSTVGTEAYPARCQTAGAMSITVIR
jgi:hypothetical protein